MPLHILNAPSDASLEAVARSFLAPALAKAGSAVLLCPSFQEALDAQRSLAETGSLAMGVAVTTPSAWAQERWEVWGDGRRLVDAVTRQVVCATVVEEAATRGEVASTPGTARLLADLVRQGAPWLAEAAGAPCDGVTDAERAVAALAAPYVERLSELGMVEECDATARLAGIFARSGVSVAPLALVGFSSLTRAQRDLVRSLARAGEVCLVLPADAGPAAAPALALAGELSRGLEDVATREVPAATPAPRSAELNDLLGQLFCPDQGRHVAPTGAFGVLLPAGPAAEPELVCREVARLAGSGASDVVVAAPDAAAAWRTLSGRLATRGASVRCQLSVPVSSLPAGRAVMAYLRGVSRLAVLAEGWPAPEPVPGRGSDVRVTVGDMSWWPPRDLSDFLLSEVSHVPAARARALDRDWRANRLLTPQAVLDQLSSEKEVGASCAQATRELLRGRIGSAASKLLAPYVAALADGAAAAGEPQSAVEARAVLTAVLSVAKSLKEAGLTADPQADARVGLDVLVEHACNVLGHAPVALRLAHEVQGASCRVLVASTAVACHLAPGSADALVLMGQTSTESAVSPADGPFQAILSAYGIEEPPDPMARARAGFAALARVPRTRLTLVRRLFGADAKECYPSVMMGECLACYGLDASAGASDLACVLGEKDVRGRSETLVGANLSASGERPATEASERPAAPGAIEPSRRAGVMAPPEGVSVEDSRPLLSASQIETYLECPYKWFSLRRLRLRDADAGFTGAEMGTFAHRVLEVSHKELLAHAMERAAGTSELERIATEDDQGAHGEAWCAEVDRLATLAGVDPTARVAGSRVGLSDERGLEVARQALLAEFDAHLSHQYQLVRGRRPLPQALVAHTAAERGQVEALRRDLSTLLDYEAGLLAGYEPRLFEWSFGRGGAEVEYAGVRLTGTVDRVDVDAHGQAVVIDYKHKSDRGFAAEYDVFTKEGATATAGFAMPRRVQSLIYGQVIRHAFPDLKVTGAVYLCTKGAHELAGAVGEDALDNVFGAHAPSSQRLPRLAVPRAFGFGRTDGSGMEALLDACEEAIAEQVSRMLAGDVEASPKDPESCRFCPVLNCERRLGK